MLLSLAIALLFLFGIIYLLASDGMYKNDTGFAIFATIIVPAIGFLFGVMITMLVSASLWDTDYEVLERTETELVALQDGLGIEGTFFLGCGGIGTDMNYYYYYKTETGGFKQGSSNPSRTEVHYVDGTPKLVTLKRMFPKDNWKRSWLISSGFETVHLQVPEGTIKTGYNLDLQ